GSTRPQHIDAGMFGRPESDQGGPVAETVLSGEGVEVLLGPDPASVSEHDAVAQVQLDWPDGDAPGLAEFGALAGTHPGVAMDQLTRAGVSRPTEALGPDVLGLGVRYD
ncbi:hypothetical protein, partial [Methylobacterium sp. B1]|uniref:hypothetical protein n=1 Tax=Methylobacterium sp. B1 TaxID=91459 RepID=UPI001AEBB188